MGRNVGVRPAERRTPMDSNESIALVVATDRSAIDLFQGPGIEKSRIDFSRRPLETGEAYRAYGRLKVIRNV